jgi:hypothetical protein
VTLNVGIQNDLALSVEIQNDSALSVVTQNAMDVPMVRSYQDAMASRLARFVAHYAAIHFAMELHFVAVDRFSVAALRSVVGLLPLEVVHFFAVAVQTLASAIHSLAQVAPVQFVHDRASVSRPNLNLCLDRCVSDDLHRRLAL